MKRGLLGAALVATACCGPKGGANNPHPELTVEAVNSELARSREAMSSFTGESVMDYWVSGQRMKGDVLVMGKIGKLVRFAALSPAGGSTIVEMACDGTNYVYVNYQSNCSLTGPCDARSVAMFFGIELEPDDFIHLALGTPPSIGANPTGTLTWDSSKGLQRVELSEGGVTQKLAIDTKPATWDVREVALDSGDGKPRWSATNADFKQVEGSGERRVPGKTRFKSPAQSQDLLVEWKQMKVNAQLPAQNFTIQVPPGLSTCGQQPASGGAPAKP